MSRRNRIPPTVEASLEARLAPFVSPEATQNESHHRHRLLRDIKLLFAALGAGGSAVPMGDNGHATRQLVSLAACLRDS